MPNPFAPSGLAVGKVMLRTPEFALAATVAGWLVVNVWFTPADPWPEWLLVDWLKRVVLLVPLLIHPETFRWIRSAFTQGVYRYESRGLFILRTLSLAILLLVLHYLCEWVRWTWLLPLDPEQPYYPYVEDPFWRRFDLVIGLALVAFSEEIVDRVVMLRVLRRHLRQEWLCVLVSAAIFGLFHLNYGWDDVISTALLGVAFAVVYLRTQSIWPVAAGHYLINFTVFAGP